MLCADAEGTVEGGYPQARGGLRRPSISRIYLHSPFAGTGPWFEADPHRDPGFLQWLRTPRWCFLRHLSSPSRVGGPGSRRWGGLEGGWGQGRRC